MSIWFILYCVGILSDSWTPYQFLHRVSEVQYFECPRKVGTLKALGWGGFYMGDDVCRFQGRSNDLRTAHSDVVLTLDIFQTRTWYWTLWGKVHMKIEEGGQSLWRHSMLRSSLKRGHLILVIIITSYPSSIIHSKKPPIHQSSTSLYFPLPWSSHPVLQLINLAPMIFSPNSLTSSSNSRQPHKVLHHLRVVRSSYRKSSCTLNQSFVTFPGENETHQDQ